MFVLILIVLSARRGYTGCKSARMQMKNEPSGGECHSVHARGRQKRRLRLNSGALGTVGSVGWE